MFAENPVEYEEDDPEIVVCVLSSHLVDELMLFPALADTDGSQLPVVCSFVACAFSIAPRACTIEGKVSIARTIASSNVIDWVCAPAVGKIRQPITANKQIVLLMVSVFP